jgi:3-dehydroquinate dehydratase/shikimate dehydrogenase
LSARTRLAVPITSTDVPLAEQVRAARAFGADLVELRVDCLADVAAVEALFGQPPILPMILTIRSAEEGGAWVGSEPERIALLHRLGLYRPAYMDVEYAAWQRSASVRQEISAVCELERRNELPRAAEHPQAASRPKSQLILSHHDLRSTPTDLAAVFDRLVDTPAQVIKAAFAARDATDAWRVLAQLRRLGPQRNVIALSMGEAGLSTRILARKLGAFLTFASPGPGRESAPGQPTLAELRQLYGWNRIGLDTRIFGVVGWPVAHSLSPAAHNAAMTAAGINGVFLPLPVQPTFLDWAAFMDGLTQETSPTVNGLSVTLPHKENAFRWLQERGFEIQPLAQRCGAVNTLTRRPDGTWEGDNTDAQGALAALRSAAGPAGDWLSGLRVDVLGAGGAARAIVTALREQGCQITVYNRSPERAARLAQELRCAWRPWEARAGCAGDILINCTSVGLWPAVHESPMPDDALRPPTVVFDTVYRPARTRLLRAAAARGCRIISGLEMFIGQAAAQFEHWHRAAAPLDAMREAVRAQGTY